MTGRGLTPEAGAAGPAAEASKKEYSKDASACMISFWLAREVAPDARQAAAAKTFDQWNENSQLMNGLKSGDFAPAVELEAGEEYEFRYLIHGAVGERLKCGHIRVVGLRRL